MHPSATESLFLEDTFPTSRPACASRDCASDSDLPVRLGTSAFSAPMLTFIFTVSPSFNLVPATGSVEITSPSSTSSLYVASDFTTNPASSRIFWASDSDLPVTSGTLTSSAFLPLLITSSTCEFFLAFLPPTGLCCITSPLSYLSDSFLAVIL